MNEGKGGKRVLAPDVAVHEPKVQDTLRSKPFLFFLFSLWGRRTVNPTQMCAAQTELLKQLPGFPNSLFTATFSSQSKRPTGKAQMVIYNIILYSVFIKVSNSFCQKCLRFRRQNNTMSTLPNTHQKPKRQVLTALILSPVDKARDPCSAGEHLPHTVTLCRRSTQVGDHSSSVGHGAESDSVLCC